MKKRETMGIIIILGAVIFFLVAALPKSDAVSKLGRALVVFITAVSVVAFMFWANSQNKKYENSDREISGITKNLVDKTYELGFKDGEKVTVPASIRTIETNKTLGYPQSLKTQYNVTSSLWQKLFLTPLNTYEKEQTLYLNK